MVKTEIKICGVRTPEIAREAERLGAKYIGLIFAESPRRVTVAEAKSVIAALEGKAKPVGVFVKETADEVDAIAGECGIGIVQLHRRASADEVAILKAKGYEVWTLAGGAQGDAVLFDSSHGDGETEMKKGAYKCVLAGGIGAANIAEALASGADVIDVSGSLEETKGVKSVRLLREFFETAKNTENAKEKMR